MLVYVRLFKYYINIYLFFFVIAVAHNVIIYILMCVSRLE